MIAEIIVHFLDARDVVKQEREKKSLEKFNQEFYVWLEGFHNDQSRKAL